jgi:membrane protease YdiL (CAAX protease family)
VRLALVFYGALFAAALAWAWLASRSLWFASPAAAARGMAPLRDASLGLLAAGVVIVLSRQFTARTRAGDQLARALAAVIGRRTLPECLLLAGVSGVAEEAFFRGALQPQVGLVAASLLFGLAHFAPRRDLLPWTAFSIAAGFLLGFLFAATGNLLAPVLAHAAINAVNLRFLSLRYAPVD